MRTSIWCATLLYLPLILCACDKPPEVGVVQARLLDSAVAQLAGGPGVICSEVGYLRVCWTGSASCSGGCVEQRTLPTGVARADGLRCFVEAGSGWQCQPRTATASPFKCRGDTCKQAFVHLPDASEWECIDDHGAVRCRRAAVAAGVPGERLAPSFLCGERRSAEREPVCVDFSPDVPDEDHLRCRIEHAFGRLSRTCKAGVRPALGATCEIAKDCPEGASCIDGHCLPPRPAPNCWFDKDCGDGGHCRFGTCTLES